MFIFSAMFPEGIILLLWTSVSSTVKWDVRKYIQCLSNILDSVFSRRPEVKWLAGFQLSLVAWIWDSFFGLIVEHIHDKPSSTGQNSKAATKRWTRVCPNCGRRPRPSWKAKAGWVAWAGGARAVSQSVSHGSLRSKLPGDTQVRIMEESWTVCFQGYAGKCHPLRRVFGKTQRKSSRPASIVWRMGRWRGV